MPIELGVWRIDQTIEPIVPQRLDNEAMLEQLIEKHIDIVAPDLMVIGRQVATSFGKIVDLLAINSMGDLVVIELKRDRTPREVVAQVLDYGSWVHTLESDQIAAIWGKYVDRCGHDRIKGKSLDQAFCEHFNASSMPDDINEDHELIIVASALDESTERIVDYLAGHRGLKINAVFFRAFKDGDRQYLTRAWLRDPSSDPIEANEANVDNGWNGEYYVSFGGERNWEDAAKYGYISAGGKSWYSNSLQMLSPGDRIWVNIPNTGYVGVGIVAQSRVPIDDFYITDDNGKQISILQSGARIGNRTRYVDDPEGCEYLVRVNWLKTLDRDSAIKEKGLFGNQNTVARPTKPKWGYTVQRLKARLGITE